jgi:hypothetical protein
VNTLDNTQAHCAQLHTNDRNRAEAYADRMLSLGYRVTTSSDYSPTKRGAVYTVTVARTRAEELRAEREAFNATEPTGLRWEQVELDHAEELATLENDRPSGNTGATD